MKKCYIVGAADFAPARFRPGPDDLVIAADAGCLHLERLGLRPDIILGDFDSLGRVPDFPDVEVSPRAQGRHGLHARRTAGHRARLRYAALLRLPGREAARPYNREHPDHSLGRQRGRCGLPHRQRLLPYRPARRREPDVRRAVLGRLLRLLPRRRRAGCHGAPPELHARGRGAHRPLSRSA